MAPTVQKAIVIQPDGSIALREVAVPKPGPDEILVKVVAAAQNPADCGWEVSTTIISYMRFSLGFVQGSLHCTASTPEQSLGATSRVLSRRSGRTSRKVCAR